jgi:hypothetical protein
LKLLQYSNKCGGLLLSTDRSLRVENAGEPPHFFGLIKLFLVVRLFH